MDESNAGTAPATIFGNRENDHDNEDVRRMFQAAQRIGRRTGRPAAMPIVLAAPRPANYRVLPVSLCEFVGQIC
jgi:hypothetical protein